MTIYSRELWTPAHGRGFETDGPKTIVVVHNDSIDFPSRSTADMTIEQEAALLRMYEKFHASKLTKEKPRIAYQFAGFQSGRVWEGIGWGRIGAHTARMNSVAVAFFVPINGNEDAPTPALVEAFHAWRAEGVRLEKLSPRHIVRGHQDYGKPSCPGSKLYQGLVKNAFSTEAPRLRDTIASHPSLRFGKGGRAAPLRERMLVKYLQERLTAAGFMGIPSYPGWFGQETDTAVRVLQVRAGLRKSALGGTAIVGPATWKVVDAL